MSTHRHSTDIIVPGRNVQPIESVSHLSPEHDMTPKQADLARTLGTLSANSLFLLESTGIPVDGTPNVSLTAMDDLALGRQRSQHGVQFGQLVIEGGDDTKTSELVAVKYLSPRKAAHELLVERYINHRLGRQATFQTLGFIKHEDDKRIGILSRYDHSIVSLDNTLYDPQSTDESRLAAVTIAAKYLATLHGSQLSLAHGDAQPKNIAVNSQKEPHYIDLESVRNVLTNAYGKKVTQPALNKLMDIGDFFAISPEAQDWNPTFPEADRFVETYASHQTGNHNPTDDQIMELIIEKIDDF